LVVAEVVAELVFLALILISVQVVVVQVAGS
jgi:hypothetical protein